MSGPITVAATLFVMTGVYFPHCPMEELQVYLAASIAILVGYGVAKCLNYLRPQGLRGCINLLGQ